MAIQIDSSLNLKNGMITSEAYLRIEYAVNQYGNKIVYDVFPYVSRDVYLTEKAADERDKENILLGIDNFKTSGVIGYDKDTDGLDVLQLVHTGVFDYITEDEMYDNEITDPSTGAITIETVVFREKFAMAQDVSIVDII